MSSIFGIFHLEAVYQHLIVELDVMWWNPRGAVDSRPLTLRTRTAFEPFTCFYYFLSPTT
jgi:hypothetical protein